MPLAGGATWQDAWTGLVAAGGVAGSALWVGHLIHLIRHRARVVFLADLDAPTPAASPSRVAVLFAARDEAPGVEAAVRSMLAEADRDPSLRVVAVDDRSTDGTGAILDRLAAGHHRLGVVHVADLPPGWLGKTYALQLGSNSPEALAADWLLLTDADVVFQPGAIRRAVAFAEAQGLDLLAVGPEVDTRSVGERAFLAFFGLLFSLHGPVGRLGDRDSRAYLGIGACNLVRAEAFRAIGGFRHLSLSVDEDMKLGQTIKYAGSTIGLAFGRGMVSVRWQDGTWGMIRGVEKNFFGGLKYRWSRVVVVALGIVVLGIGPFAGMVIGPTWSRWASAAGVGAITVLLAVSRRQSRIGWYYVGLIPVAAVLVLVALFRSAVLTVWRGGIVWRNHTYPLPLLREHVRERDAWLAEVWRSTR